MEFYNKPISWLSGEDEYSSVVVSTRVRLARNLANYPFIPVTSSLQKREIDNYLTEKLGSLKISSKMSLFRLHEMEPIDLLILFERHLISTEHYKAKHNRSAMITDDEKVSIMINEEDHIRMQSLEPSFNPGEAYSRLSMLDDQISDLIPYAFNDRFGYVTCCPTNIGTGLRVSVMMHLPAIVYTKQIEKVVQSLTRISYTIRGFYGEGTSPLGNLFQVSNQTTLGRSEEEIIEELVKIVPEIVRFETTWRERLKKEGKSNLENTVWRAYGVLKYARSISSQESLELLSAIRLGVNLGFITDMKQQLINELFITVQPGHLQKKFGNSMKESERDTYRAEFIRKKLNSTGI